MKKILLLILFFSMACAVDRQTENYNFEGASPLTLTVNNHPHGYQKSSCFNCHLSQNIHQVDRLRDPSFPFAAPAVEQQGLSSCSGCHGTNGVSL